MGVIERYRDRIPVIGPNTPNLTLGEGSTPLVRARRLGETLGVELWFKFEGMNPTASFKDRGMVVAVAKALEAGVDGIICASTGNTAASAAAYGAAAGLTTVVLTPTGQIAAAKGAQARAVGARVLEVRGSFDEALQSCRELADRGVFALVNSVNPDRIEGQKTAAFEINEALGSVPHVLALPYGGGGNTVAYCKGFTEEGVKPRILQGEATARATTLATAIRIAEPAHQHEIDDLDAQGWLERVSLSDEEIAHAWHEIANNEGLFCEPSSAAGFAALKHAELEKGSTVVCVLTGHGLKDTSRVDAMAAPSRLVDADADSIRAEAMQP